MERVRDLKEGDHFRMLGTDYIVRQIVDGRIGYGPNSIRGRMYMSAQSKQIIEIIKTVKIIKMEPTLKPKIETTLSDVVEEYSRDFEKTLDMFTSVVSEVFEVAAIDLFKKTRKRDIVDARITVFYLFCMYTTFKHDDIALAFNMDRTSVINGRDRTKDLSRTNDEYAHLFKLVHSRVARHAA